MQLVHFSEDLKIDAMTLEECLEAISKYGRPSVRKNSYSDGWSSSIDMFVSGKGVEFSIRGEGHTPSDAAKDCLHRVNKTLKELNK